MCELICIFDDMFSVSQIKDIFGASWAFFLAVAEGAAFVLHELELVFVEQEEFAALAAVFEEDFWGDVDEVFDGESGVYFTLVDEIDWFVV